VNKLIKVPDVLITDYDDTLLSLYRDNNVLIEIWKSINELYNRYFEVPKEYLENYRDAYHLWYQLHRLALEKLDMNVAEEVNMQAEQIVTDFEHKAAQNKKLFPGVLEAVQELNRSRD